MRKRRSAQQRQANRWLKMFHIDLKTLFTKISGDDKVFRIKGDWQYWIFCSFLHKKGIESVLINILKLSWGVFLRQESWLKIWKLFLKTKFFYIWDNEIGVTLIRKYYHLMTHSYTSEKSSQPSTFQWSELSKITLSKYQIVRYTAIFHPPVVKIIFTAPAVEIHLFVCQYYYRYFALNIVSVILSVF